MHAPCSFHHSCSWAVKKKKLGVSLPRSRPWSVFFFFCISFPSNSLRATSFFVCLQRLCLRRSPGVRQVLTLSHTLSPSSKSDPGRLEVSFSFVCLEKSQGSERLYPIHARTTALLNQPQAQLTDNRRIDMHVNPQGLLLILEKFCQANRLRKYYLVIRFVVCQYKKKFVVRQKASSEKGMRERERERERERDREGGGGVAGVTRDELENELAGRFTLNQRHKCADLPSSWRLTSTRTHSPPRTLVFRGFTSHQLGSRSLTLGPPVDTAFMTSHGHQRTATSGR